MNALARLAVIGFLPLVSLSAGCTSQSEGQRCDLPSDCQSNLICTNLNGTLKSYMVCCPPPPAQSSVPSCNPGLAPPDVDAAVDASETDVLPEASPTEAAADGAAEAADDGSGQVSEGGSADAGAE
jgi:hypothetical protein